jgi:hypothetical protein
MSQMMACSDWSKPGLLCAKLLHRGMRGQEAGKVLRTDDVAWKIAVDLWLKSSSTPLWDPQEMTFKNVKQVFIWFYMCIPFAPNGCQKFKGSSLFLRPTTWESNTCLAAEKIPQRPKQPMEANLWMPEIIQDGIWSKELGTMTTLW